MRLFAHKWHTRHCYTIVERQSHLFSWPRWTSKGTEDHLVFALYKLQVISVLQKSSSLCVKDPGQIGSRVIVSGMGQSDDVGNLWDKDLSKPCLHLLCWECSVTASGALQAGMGYAAWDVPIGQLGGYMEDAEQLILLCLKVLSPWSYLSPLTNDTYP